MSLSEEQQHGHSGMGGDGKKVRASDLDWGGFSLTGTKIFCFDLWCLSGATADNGFRDILFPGVSGDMQKSFTASPINGLGSMTGYITMRDTTGTYDNVKSIVLKSGEIFEASAYIYNAGGNLKINRVGGTARYLRGSSDILTPSNPEVSFINASASDMTLTFQYAVSDSTRPIVGCLCKIY